MQQKYADDPLVSAWLSASIENSRYVERQPDETNENLLELTDGFGYQRIFQNKYITYLGAILSFIIVGLAYYFINLDDKVRSREIYSHLLGSKKRYFYHQYLAMVIPMIVIFYLLGLILNAYSYSSFIGAGYDIPYLPFIIAYAMFFVPPILLFSSVAAFIVVALKKSMSFIPLYMLWCVMNISPDALAGGKFFDLFVFFKRLDAEPISLTPRLIGIQLAGVIISFAIFELACRIRLRKER